MTVCPNGALKEVPGKADQKEAIQERRSNYNLMAPQKRENSEGDPKDSAP